MPSSPLVTLHRPTPKQALAAAIIFLITALILRSAALAHFSTHYLGGSERDAGLYIWLVKSNLRDLFSLPWFDTKAFYPYGQSLAWSDNFILPSLVIWPLTKLGLTLPAAYNTVLLGAQILNGLALFLLSFAVYGAWTPALVAGVAVVSSSTLTQHLGHPQLQFIFWIPLGMLAALRLAERPTLLRAIVPGLLLVGSFLCTVYYTIFLALALCVVGLALLLLRSTKESVTILMISAIGTLMAALMLLPFAGPYIHTHAAFGARKLYEMYYFAATGLSFLSAPATNNWYGATASLSHSEANFFPGFIVIGCGLAAVVSMLKPLLRSVPATIFLLALMLVIVLSATGSAPSGVALLAWLTLAALGILLDRQGQRTSSSLSAQHLSLVLLFVAVVFFAAALGPLSNSDQSQFSLGLYRLLYAIFPGADSLRAVSRFGLVSLLLIFTLSAEVLSQLKNPWLRIGLSLLLGLLIVIENYTPLYPLEPETPRPMSFAKLAVDASAQDSAIVLPLAPTLDRQGAPESWGKFAELNVQALLFGFDANIPLVNGYSGQRTKLHRELMPELKSFPDIRSIHALSKISNLRYIILNSREVPGFFREAFQQKLAEWSLVLKLVLADQDGFWLLEFSPITDLDSDFRIWAPASSNGELELELAAPNSPKDVPLVVEAFLDGETQTPLAKIELSHPGQFELFSLKLKRGNNPVFPYRVGFRLPPGQTIVLRRRGFVISN